VNLTTVFIMSWRGKFVGWKKSKKFTVNGPGDFNYPKGNPREKDMEWGDNKRIVAKANMWCVE